MQKNKIRLIFIVIIFFGIFGVAKFSQAANWYVDNSISASGNGQAWGTAWKNFANINWGSVACGDTIYISGGATGNSQEYSERLKIEGKNCTQVSPLIITVGTDSNHNGMVKITGAPNLYSAISIVNTAWLTIDGQSNGDGNRHIEIYQKESCINCANSGIAIGGNTGQSMSSGIKLKYLYLHDIGSINNDYHTAIIFRFENVTYNHDNEISYSLIEKTIDAISCGFIGSQKGDSYGGLSIHHNTIKAYDDGIQTSGNTDIYNNNISRDTYVGKGHPDGIQAYGSYVRIFNNYFYGFLNQEAGNSVVYWEPDGGENMDVNEHQPSNFMLYNNVFYETGTTASIFAVSLGIGDSRFISVSDLYILNNTFSGAYVGALMLSMDDTPSTKVVIENNVFYNAATTNNVMMALNKPAPGTFGGHGSGADIIVDYNHYYKSSGTNQIVFNGKYYNYSNFINLSGSGMQVHPSDATSDPNINFSNLKPLANSLLINSGADLSFISGLVDTKDKNGVARSAGAWDIGAYEYVSNADTTPPAPPSGLTIN